MSPHAFILTTKDFTILEVMLELCLGKDDPRGPLLRQTVQTAQVVFRDDVSADVATLNKPCGVQRRRTGSRHARHLA